MQKCPCGSQKDYLHCCGLFIEEKQLPATPEELMRSRYTAYTQMNVNYILDTMKGPAADRMDEKGIRKRAKKIKWIKLEVIAMRWDYSEKGFVEFRAFYSRNNKTHVLHEISEFHCENGKWFYVDGQFQN
jgi:SEC-C motif-containing protein